MEFVRLPKGKIFLATIDMVALVSSTSKYSRPPSRIRTHNTRSRAPPERPRRNSAGQVTSNPLFRNFAGHHHEKAFFLGVAVITTFMLTLGPLLGLSLRACGRTRLPSIGPGVPPLIRVGVASILVLVLPVLVWLAISASSSSTLALVLAFPRAFRLALAGVVAVALATALAKAFAGIFALQLRRQALLVVALILIVLPPPTEGTRDSAPVMIRHLRLGAGVGLLLLPLDHEAIALLTVRGTPQVTMLVSSVTPEELLDMAHDTGVLGASPLSRSRSLAPFAMAPRASSSRRVGVQVLVAFFFQRQLQE